MLFHCTFRRFPYCPHQDEVRSKHGVKVRFPVFYFTSVPVTDASFILEFLGAHIMNSLASSLTQKPTPERRKQAEIWLRKALHVIDETKTVAKNQNTPSASEEIGQCELTLAVALFNLGELREVSLYVSLLKHFSTMLRTPVDGRRQSRRTEMVHSQSQTVVNYQTT